MAVLNSTIGNSPQKWHLRKGRTEVKEPSLPPFEGGTLWAEGTSQAKAHSQEYNGCNRETPRRPVWLELSQGGRMAGNEVREVRAGVARGARSCTHSLAIVKTLEIFKEGSDTV